MDSYIHKYTLSSHLDIPFYSIISLYSYKWMAHIQCLKYTYFFPRPWNNPLWGNIKVIGWRGFIQGYNMINPIIKNVCLVIRLLIRRFSWLKRSRIKNNNPRGNRRNGYGAVITFFLIMWMLHNELLRQPDAYHSNYVWGIITATVNMGVGNMTLSDTLKNVVQMELWFQGDIIGTFVRKLASIFMRWC